MPFIQVTIRSPKLSFAVFAKKKMKYTASAGFGAPGFPLRGRISSLPFSHVCLSSLQHSEQRARLQPTRLQEERFSSVSLIIPITITASMRENNKHHSAFMSCLQWL